ncbi:hypothetical protein AZI85_14470 [Bdellovibrio bacteriovorus]|uniref:Lipoprotein n=1 Tax=Bdellovibrio bacteriovorus TaxID=959 RepID=A0A150WUZ8_BDEBC|nr:hypothetical protein [Bdellovibrio bacteriovorus]KYG70337.1 hypothetical protein AZI85_14470 [Bdellovibrio bacteriovorus]
MKSLFKVACFIVLSVGITSCATEKKYQKKIDGWIGFTPQELEKAWGEPAKTIKNDDGTQLIYFQLIDSDLAPAAPLQKVIGEKPHYMIMDYYLPFGKEAVYESNADKLPPRSLTYTCSTFFEIGANGTISRAGFYGNKCRIR